MSYVLITIYHNDILIILCFYFRVERVEAGLPADQAGLRPGDYVIFVGKSNVVTLQEDEILQIIK